MKDFRSEIFQLRESNYNIGWKLGSFIKEKPIYKTLQRISKNEFNVHNMKHIFSTFAPHLLDELHGIGDSLGISYKKAYALFSGYDLPKVGALGCTAFATNEFYVRNYDFSPDLYDGLFSLCQTTSSYATAGYNLQLIGRHDGVNEKGLVAGLHFVSNKGFREGVSAWTSIRIVLDTCATIHEAILVLKEIPHSACYNFSLADSSGDFVIVEATPEIVHVRYEESTLKCENHFQSNHMHGFNREYIESSLKRHEQLIHLQHKHFSHEQMFDYFRNDQSALFFKDYENLFGTLHTFSYHFKSSRILTTIAKCEKCIDIEFNDWINGKNVSVNQLVGKLDF